ncbi:hypothetical protein M0R72_12195 [Candidatus Pacearchaeota archaeon]|jgi:hypothetical protein|nr:hypothetical protein [Candidatus Pacearchaeota archaeon]
MAVSTPLVVGGKEYHLRYTNRQQQDIRNNGPKKFLPEGSKVKRFASPMSILDYMGDQDVQVYLIEKGLEWEQSGFEKINADKAADLRQEYLEQGEADAGEKQEALMELLADALALNVLGASAKKLQEKGKIAQEKEAEKSHEKKVEEYALINEARILAQARAAKKLELEGLPGPGTNTSENPQNSA